MSITGNLYVGVSGMQSHSEAMSIVSDNIANLNTVGFKSSRANFSDVLGATIAEHPSGQGSRISSVQTSFKQGALLGTGNETDLAIEGDGFFVVSGTHGGINGNFFTRSGQFKINQDGYLVNPSDLRLQGYSADAAGDLNASIADIKIIQKSIIPNPTTEMNLTANLDAEQSVSATPFDITDPKNTSDYATSITVYDSLGKSHQLEVYFKKTQDVPVGQWTYHMTTSGSDVAPVSTDPLVEVGSGTLTFNSDGSLAANSTSSINVNWLGADSSTINLDFGSPTGSGGNGVDGITTYALDSSTSFMSQNGYSSGDIAGVQIDEEGNISGLFTNGQKRPLGQVIMARFTSNQGLERRGSGLYATTSDTDLPVMGTPGQGGRGSIISGSLEASNVDVATEFVNMIALQRGFQSNSKIITTADQMIMETLQLKG